MILIADSGSTKTDWVLIDKTNGNSSISTQGFNPFFFTSEEITKEVRKYFGIVETNHLIKAIYFYGAGCSSDAMKEIIMNGLQPVFTNATITVKSDLLGAARSLFFNDPGIAVILGTGASSGMYNGTYINKTIKSLGYIFGDEGGGDHIGKLFITKFLTDSLSKEITEKFINNFNLTKDQILQKVYSEPFPNNFLASFCEFISENKSSKEINEIIHQSFNLLFERYISKYPDYKNYRIRVTGSIGYIFETELKFVADQHDCKIDLILQKPISKLIDFHANNYS
jgi:N-acetylglucosamine kinase-like BadF-type ATPase